MRYNPFRPSRVYVPDGEPHVFGDRVYLYGSHDRFNGHAFSRQACMEPICLLPDGVGPQVEIISSLYEFELSRSR